MESRIWSGHRLQLARTWLASAAVIGVVGGPLAAPNALASSADATWFKSQSIGPAVGATGGGDGNGLAVAPNGKGIVAGWFEGTVYFPKAADDSFALTAQSDDDVFVAEWDPTTNYFTKVQQVSGPGNANARGVSMAGSYAIITGDLGTGTHYFPRGDDSIAITTAGGYNTFVAKWNPATGNFVWAQGVVGSLGSMVFPQAVATTGASGAPIVSGYATTSPIYFPTGAGDDSIALDFGSNMSGFVAQMRSADDSYFAWAQAITSSGGSHYVLGDTVAAVGTNAPVVTGSFRGSARFPNGPGTSIALSDSDDTESVFLAAMTGDDSYFAWAQAIRSVGASSVVESGSVAMKSNGTPVVSGQFAGTVYFPKGSGDDSIALSSSGTRDAFVAATGSADDSYFSWALLVRGSAGAVIRSLSVAVDSTGSPVISGDFTGTASFSTGTGTDISLVGDDTAAVYVAGVKPDGSGFAWAIKAGGSGKAISTTVATGSSGSIMAAGFFGGQVTFATTLTAKGTTSVNPDPQRNPFVASITANSSPTPDPVPPAPAPVYPASAPTGVTAAAGDASAKVTWSAPTSTGSFPVNSYQATATPGGQSCLVAAPALTCGVTGLTNGTTYTFKVRALNGAGWSADSEPSNAVTPKGVDPPPVDKTITITGSRSGTKIVITGSSTGIDPGSVLKPWLRFSGQSTFVEGVASIPVQEKGAFTWERRAGKKAYVYIQTADGKVKSNTVTIAAR